MLRLPVDLKETWLDLRRLSRLLFFPCCRLHQALRVHQLSSLCRLLRMEPL